MYVGCILLDLFFLRIEVLIVRMFDFLIWMEIYCILFWLFCLKWGWSFCIWKKGYECYENVIELNSWKFEIIILLGCMKGINVFIDIVFLNVYWGLRN